MKAVGLTTLSVADSLRFAASVAAPALAEGVIIRRSAVERLAERADWTARAVAAMQRLRARYGDGPLMVRNPVRAQAVLVSGEHVVRVLQGAPSPFSPASSEKRSALGHFEPANSLLTRAPERAVRRALSDFTLQSDSPIHNLATRLQDIVETEAAELSSACKAARELNWTEFSAAWFRAVRRITLGESARDDCALINDLSRLRRRANWGFVLPRRRRLQRDVRRRLDDYLSRGDADAFVGVARSFPQIGRACASDQIAQWLFAFDGAAAAAFRALALLLSHPAAGACAREEAAAPQSIEQRFVFLRASIVESVRLFPTTPLLLRQAVQKTEWEGGSLPAGAGVLIYAPFFHRDNERLTWADRFSPEMWLREDPAALAPLVPFSAGPGACPGRWIAPFVGAAFLATLIRNCPLASARKRDLGPQKPLPRTLSHFDLRFPVP